MLTEQAGAAKVRRRRAGREFSRNSHLGRPEGHPKGEHTLLQVNGISAEPGGATPAYYSTLTAPSGSLLYLCAGTHDPVTDGLALWPRTHAGKVAGMMLRHPHNLG